jgi:hypothetical protein
MIESQWCGVVKDQIDLKLKKCATNLSTACKCAYWGIEFEHNKILLLICSFEMSYVQENQPLYQQQKNPTTEVKTYILHYQQNIVQPISNLMI